MENGVFHDDFDEDNVATQSVREMLQVPNIIALDIKVH